MRAENLLRHFLHQLGYWLAPRRVGRFLLNRTTRYVLSWLLAVGAAALALGVAWIAFDDPDRPDGNRGHTTIDFGGQWLMGRMLVEGHARELYHRPVQRQVLSRAYPRQDEDPQQDGHDDDNLMIWCVGHDDPEAARTIASFLLPLADQHGPAVAVLAGVARRRWTEERLAEAGRPAVGGPLYPPIHALLMVPLALLRPPLAYRLNQVVGLLLAFVAGWGVRQLTDGRIWWPLAATAVIAYPGFGGSLNLGQNAALTLTILVWGWLWLARGRPVLAGALWGLLAFKPVWAAAFFLVPLLTRRWRFAAAMLAVGLGMILITLPVVGWQAWLDWFQVGRFASRLYTFDENWIFLSRDVLSIPRRWLLDFQAPYGAADRLAATVMGWFLLAGVLELTVRFTVLRAPQTGAVAGPGAAFVLLGAWLGCYHFMYYDVLLTALPVLLLFTEPRRYVEPRLVAIVPLGGPEPKSAAADYYQPRFAGSYPALLPPLRATFPQVWVLNSFVLTLLGVMAVIEFLFPVLSIDVAVNAGVLQTLRVNVPQPIKFATNLKGPPWHTFCLMVLWLWCAGVCVWTARRSADLSQRRTAPSTAGPRPADAAQLVELRADVGRAHERLAHEDGANPGRL